MKNKKRVLAILPAFFYFIVCESGLQTAGRQSASALAKSGGETAAVGIHADRLDRIYQVLRGHVQRAELPGAVVLLAHKGKIIGLESMGLADLEEKRPMKPDSIFRLASATKIITTVALLTLYEEGKFVMRNSVSEYLPEFQNLTVYGPSNKPEPVKNRLRIHDLLRHTSGFGYGYVEPQQTDYREAGILRPGPTLDWTHNWTLDQWAARLATVPLAEEPGTKFNYGLSSDIMGLLIERISGQPLDRFMQERIFTPLGMESTGFVVSADQQSRLTSIYEIQEGKITALDRAENSPLLSRPKALSGGGGWDSLGNAGLVSSAPNLFRFLQMLLNGGELDGVRILSRKTVELMLQNHLSGIGSSDSFWPGVGFGFGYAVLYDTGKFGEAGSQGTIWWAGSTNVHYWIDPREELIGVLMLQVRPFPYLNVMDLVRSMSFHIL